MKITNYKGEYKELPWDNASTEYCEVPYIENFHKPDLCRYDIPIINEVLGVDMGGYYGTLRLSGNWCWRRKVGVVICDDKEEDAYADATPEKILKHYNSAFPKHDKIENETKKGKRIRLVNETSDLIIKGFEKYIGRKINDEEQKIMKNRHDT